MDLIVICSQCVKDEARAGQRYCRACHAAKMRKWRHERIFIKKTLATVLICNQK